MKKLIVLSFMLVAISNVQAQRVETIAGFLHVYPYNLGYFPSMPTASLIANINSNAPYGFNDWRLPTRDELSLIMANRDRISGLETGQYISSDGHSSGFLRLVSTGRSVAQQAEQRRIAEQQGITPVVINGVRWATRNVGSQGTFVSQPENFGGYFTSSTARNACPVGWRLPTMSEVRSLSDAPSRWSSLNGVPGRVFGSSPNEIFLPAAGGRYEGLTGGIREVGFIRGTNVMGYANIILVFDRAEWGWDWQERDQAKVELSVRCVQE